MTMELPISPPLKAHRTEWPDSRDRINRLADRGDTAGALRLCTAECAKLPNAPAPFLLAARLHMKLPDTDAARRALDQARSNGLSDAPWLRCRAQLHLLCGDMAGFAADIGHLFAAGETIHPRHLQTAARFHIDQGNPDQAEPLVDLVLARDPSRPAARLKAEIAFERAHYANLDQVVEALLRAPGAVPEIATAICHLQHYVSGAPGDITRLFGVARDLWPDANVIPQLEASIVERTPATTPAPAPTTAAQRLRAERMLQQSITTGRTRPETLAADFRRQTENHALLRPIITDDPAKDVIVSPHTQGQNVVIVFTGLADVAMVPLEVTDTYLAMQNTTAIYLKDMHRLLYCRGIRSLGDDFETGVAALQSLLSALGTYKSLTVIGTSGGGQGALNFGIALNADRILCFSTTTNTTTAFLNSIGDTRGKTVVRRLNTLAPAPLLDIRSRLMASGFNGRIDLIYGADDEIDRKHAENLKGIGNTALHPIPDYAAHPSLMETIARNALPDVLRGDMARLTTCSN